MGNVCACFCKKASSPDTTSASTNNTDNPEETLENIFEDIKAEIDAGNVHPKDVINLLNNHISCIKENKFFQNVESSTTGFYGLIDKIAIKWDKYAKTGIHQELGRIAGSFLKKVGESNYILVGLSIVGSILSGALKVPENKEACNEFIRNLSCLLVILDSHPSNNVDVSVMALQDLADEIMNSITICCKYATSGFGIQMLNSNALEEELKKTSQQLLAKVQNLQLDAGLKALYGIDQIDKKLDTMKTTHIKVAEDDVDENIVGIKQRVDDVKKLLRLENKEVREVAVVLLGQGGMGKSTLARSVISSAKPHLSHGFTVASVCFDSDRKDLETQKRELQSSILHQLSGNKTTIHDLKAGQIELRKVFCSEPCFVLVDNVVQCSQLSNFFPDHLPSDGSCSLRILVTSRDRDVERYLGFEMVEIYAVDRLDHDSSVVSLRKYMGVPANSREEKFSAEFEKMERIAKLCYGTPILICTIGRDLKRRRNKSEYYNDHCDEVIRRLEEADLSIYSDLKFEDFMLSVFNLLNEKIKASFLDICKFLYMRDWDEVRYIIGDTTMEELSDRLMIRNRKHMLFDKDVVMVHDLLRAMSLKLVENENNRLVIDIDRGVTGCLELSQLVDSDVSLNKIEGLFISYPRHYQVKTIYVEPKVFQRLRLLEMNGIQLKFRNEDMDYVPNKLEYLAVGYYYTCREQSQIFTLLKTKKSSTPLRALSLQNMHGEFSANMEKLLNLQSLQLTDCPHLRELPSGISHLVRLKRITLNFCQNLRYLPEELGQLGSLEKLDLRGCSELEGLPISAVKWQRLKKLDMSDCSSIQRLPEDMGMLKSLQYLDLHNCVKLECLPSKLAGLVSLEKLDLKGCEIIEALPDDIGRLRCLKELRLSECSSLRILPVSIAGLKALEELDIDYCYQLQRLPEDIGELSSLKTLYMDNLSCRETLPSSLAKLSSLEWLSMNGWSDMVTLPDFIHNFYNLKKLYLDRCYKLKELPSYLEGFTDMEVLSLKDCKALEILFDVGKMCSLREINLAGCSKLQIIPPSIVELRHLEKLDISNCVSIQILPDVGKMGSLRSIHLEECSKLQVIPPSIVDLRHLLYLNISNCISIQNAGGFIQNMLTSFQKRGKGLWGFKYDGISEADSDD